jgi:hypothetical protein
MMSEQEEEEEKALFAKEASTVSSGLDFVISSTDEYNSW